MRQVWISKVGAPEVLQVREAPDPTPGPGQVRIRVEAAGVNFADISARLGFYPDAPKIPCVVGYEVAGRIDAVGSGVDPARVGQDVLGLTRFGGYSDVVVVPERQATVRPVGLDAQTAAAIPVTYLTAYQMLIEMGRVRSGDRVLIHQAAGGVGLAAIDLCALTGGVESFGTASASKHEFVRARGLTHPIDYHSHDYEREVMRITGGTGVDLILDPIGGDSWRKGLRLLRPTGRLLCFGMSSANPSKERSIIGGLKAIAQIPWLKVNPITLMNENKGVFGVNLGHMWDEVERLSGWLDQTLAWWSEGKVRPHVDRAFPFAEAAAAHAYIQERRNVGKVLLVPS